MAIETLKDLAEFLRKNNWPKELIISGDDYERIMNKIAAPYRTPGQFQIGVALVKVKTAPVLDVSDQRLFSLPIENLSLEA